MDIRTDLALESLVYKDKDIKIRMIDENISLKTIDNGPGNRYFTYECLGNIINNDALKLILSQHMAEGIKSLINLRRFKDIKALIIGLGNRGMTADALGPKVVDKVIVKKEGSRSVCAFTPSVSGLTGLETYDIIKGISDRVRPDVILAVDTLASRRVNRISSSFQMSDSGISPGSGVGNSRTAINLETMGIPVIAIGVPLVVYAKTLVRDALSDYLNNPNKYDISEKAVEVISRALDYRPSDLVVTPKEIDIIVDNAAEIIACALNICFFGKRAAYR